ncbi:MAG TPA: hypothetical protein VMW35_22600 [Myxococcota bacterium]|jgi:hypothetical protein|nr:hypothetical protein [Myxococcota bacterium]
MTNDEAMYAWKAKRLAADPSLVGDSESWRRHPPAVPAVAAVLARTLPLDDALALATQLALVASLAAAAWLGGRLAGGVAAVAAPCLLALDDTVRCFANHFLLDLPLVVLQLGAAALFTLPGRRRLLAWPVALVAPLVKSYGVLLPLTLLVCTVYERLGRRARIALWLAGAAAVAGLLVVGQLGLVQERWYWLAPQDPLATAGRKLYGIIESFQWLWPDARGRALTLLLVPILAAAAWLLRGLPERPRTLLLFLILVPLAAIAVTRIVERRTLLLVLAPLDVALASALALALERIGTPRLRRAAAAGALALGLLALARTERTRAPSYPCLYAGQWESARWLATHVEGRSDRVFSSSTHQHRLYGGLEFEHMGGPLYGENEWTGIPSPYEEFAREVARSRGVSWLALGWNQDTMGRWLHYDAETAARLRALGFAPAAAFYLPWTPDCEPATPEAAAREDAFYRTLGYARVRPAQAGSPQQEGREYLAAFVLARIPAGAAALPPSATPDP